MKPVRSLYVVLCLFAVLCAAGANTESPSPASVGKVQKILPWDAHSKAMDFTPA